MSALQEVLLLIHGLTGAFVCNEICLNFYITLFGLTVVFRCAIAVTIETFRQGLKGGITMPRRCLCLGLGSPVFSRNSRAQLDTLLSICKQYDIVSNWSLRLSCSNTNQLHPLFLLKRHEDVTIADPAFHPEDVEGLNALGFVVTSVLGVSFFSEIPYTRAFVMKEMLWICFFYMLLTTFFFRRTVNTTLYRRYYCICRIVI